MLWQTVSSVVRRNKEVYRRPGRGLAHFLPHGLERSYDMIHASTRLFFGKDSLHSLHGQSLHDGSSNSLRIVSRMRKGEFPELIQEMSSEYARKQERSSKLAAMLDNGLSGQNFIKPLKN